MKEMHVKYRPRTFDEVIGHGAIVKSLKKTLEAGTARAFLFTGEPGLGKTTLARIIARSIGIDPDEDASNYVEYDGATNTGVDDMRAILDRARLRPLGGKRQRVIVVDECHMLSNNAWNSALKSVEEPPEGVYWVFCTSQGPKVPAAIRSRCQEFVLGELSAKDVGTLIDCTLEREKQDMLDPIYEMLVDYAAGSPRRALVGLGKLIGIDDAEEAAQVLEGVAAADSAEVIELCRQLLKGASYPALAGTVLKLQNKTTAEGIRCVVCGYMTKVCAGNQWEQASTILKAFGTPYPGGIGNALYPVLVSLAVLFES